MGILLFKKKVYTSDDLVEKLNEVITQLNNLESSESAQVAKLNLDTGVTDTNFVENADQVKPLTVK